MTTEIQQMLAQLGLLHDDMSALPADIRAEMANLIGIVNDQSLFGANLDNARTEFNSEDGGWFETLTDVFEIAPKGMMVVISLMPGQVYDIDSILTLYGRAVLFRPVPGAAGSKPKVRFRSYVHAVGTNVLYGFSPVGGGNVFFDGVDVELEGKADSGAAWGEMSAPVRYGQGTSVEAGFRDCTITGEAGQGVVTTNGGSLARVGFRDVTLDGVIGVIGAANGVAQIARSNLTLINSAALTDGGTRGTNLLYN